VVGPVTPVIPVMEGITAGAVMAVKAAAGLDLIGRALITVFMLSTRALRAARVVAAMATPATPAVTEILAVPHRL